MEEKSLVSGRGYIRLKQEREGTSLNARQYFQSCLNGSIVLKQEEDPLLKYEHESGGLPRDTGALCVCARVCVFVRVCVKVCVCFVSVHV